MAVLAWGLFAPASARASCGDYVTIRPHHESSRPEVPSKPQTAPTPCHCPDHAPDGTPLPPCPGPDCSAPAAPAPTTTLTPVRHLEDWALPAAPGSGTGPAPLTFLSSDQAERPQHFPADIFHPPR